METSMGMMDEAMAAGLGEELVWLLVHEHAVAVKPGLERLWGYYRNALDFSAGDERRPYRAEQEQGLPWRLTRGPGEAVRRSEVGGGRKEVVVENDIAWRVHAMVDFMFGKPVVIESLAEDEGKARLIEKALRACFEANGGVCFFQDLALLGSVYGFVDVLVRGMGEVGSAVISGGSAAGDGPAVRVPSGSHTEESVLRRAKMLILETVEAPRAIPVLDPTDYRRLEGYVLHYRQALNEVERSGLLGRLLGEGKRRRGRRKSVEVTEVWTGREVRVYRDGRCVASGGNGLGVLPVVHIQNLPQPFVYEGLSEVESLIPLQDELNTRLSDRANRVTFQSFKMYLGKGIEGFLERPVGPGQMWTTENPDAAIEAFGGDGPNPSEDAHIREIREAMDKASAVTPLAAGLLGGKVGNLTSENALRITLMGLLAKTEKKRLTYGRGIERLCELVLGWLDAAGVLRTREEERRVKLHWPSALPENMGQRLREAQMKLEIGVPRQRVLAELGYGAEEQG